jgi:catechol-2,3-dioxygenase
MQLRELHLQTADLGALVSFYGTLVGEDAVKLVGHQLEVKIGRSSLTFTRANQPLNGVYHVAINIPKNQFEQAKTWLRERVPFIADNAGEDSFYSENWDAHMVYFYDPAGNIVELIARHTLDNTSDVPFSQASLLSISEIGIAADDVAAQVASLSERTGARPYHWSGSSVFTPVGDAEGLFIVVQHGREWFPDTGQAAEHLPVTVVVHTGKETMRLSFLKH